MNVPTPDAFLEVFGICPDYADELEAFFQYSYRSKSGNSAVSLSFSGVSNSFQVNLSSCGEEVLVVSSEQVSSISIFEDVAQAGVRVLFDHKGVSSEAIVLLEPDLKINWWMLRA